MATAWLFALKEHRVYRAMQIHRSISILPPSEPSDGKPFEQHQISPAASVRSKHEPISMEHLHLLMEAGGHTATAKNTQMCRFDFLQDSLPEFKELIWSYLSEVYETDRIMPIPAETLGRFIENRRTDPKNDYLFRDASAVLFIRLLFCLMRARSRSDRNGGAYARYRRLYNGYLRRVVDSCPAARAYFDMSDERGLNVCMLLGYQQKRYYRTAPRRFPSVVLR